MSISIEILEKYPSTLQLDREQTEHIQQHGVGFACSDVLNSYIDNICNAGPSNQQRSND